MQLIYKDDVTVLQRNHSVIEIILEKINQLIDENDLVFSHLIIDDQEIYEDHEVYILDRLNEIERIEIVMLKTKEMIWETLQSINEYLNRAVPTLQQLVDESYDQFTESTWESIGQLTEGLDWLLRFKTFTESAKSQPANWEEFVATFATCEAQFSPLLEAMEMQDTVLISDILAYEITPAFEKLAEIVQVMLEDERYLKDSH